MLHKLILYLRKNDNMINELIQDAQMDSNYESDWIPIFQEEISGIRKKTTAQSLQILWYGVEGNLDGTIELYATNDMITASLGATIIINSTSNINNSQMFLINPLFNYIKIKYTANNITAGTLNATIYSTF
jgi:hypothetical protein